MAFISYSSQAVLGFDFLGHGKVGFNKEGVQQLIDEMNQLGGNDRNINKGLEMAGDLFSSRGGARNDARRVRQIAFC